MKICKQCKVKKEIKYFYKNSPSKDGHLNFCKECWDSKHHFGGKREHVIKRDKSSCRLCGISKSDHNDTFGRDITVDHINGDRSDNDSSNLMTLCLQCHGRKDIKKVRHYKLTENDATKIKALRGHDDMIDHLADKFNVSKCTIRDIWVGRSWRNI